MELNEYQQLAKRTMQDRGDQQNRIYTAMGLAGEAGEAAEIVKKECYHGHAVKAARVRGELGDVLWYAAMLADAYGLTLEDVAKANVAKLRRRYPNGFTAGDSVARVDTMAELALVEAYPRITQALESLGYGRAVQLNGPNATGPRYTLTVYNDVVASGGSINTVEDQLAQLNPRPADSEDKHPFYGPCDGMLPDSRCDHCWSLFFNYDLRAPANLFDLFEGGAK